MHSPNSAPPAWSESTASPISPPAPTWSPQATPPGRTATGVFIVIVTEDCAARRVPDDKAVSSATRELLVFGVGVGVVLCPESVSVAPLTTARPLRTTHRTAVAAPATAGSWDPEPQGGTTEAETAREGTPWQRYAMLSRLKYGRGADCGCPRPEEDQHQVVTPRRCLILCYYLHWRRTR